MVLPSNRKSSTTKVGAIYARYSSRFQHSIEDQIRVCKDWTEKNGIEVPDDLILLDRAVTGKSSRRQARLGGPAAVSPTSQVAAPERWQRPAAVVVSASRALRRLL